MSFLQLVPNIAGGAPPANPANPATDVHSLLGTPISVSFRPSSVAPTSGTNSNEKAHSVKSSFPLTIEFQESGVRMNDPSTGLYTYALLVCMTFGEGEVPELPNIPWAIHIGPDRPLKTAFKEKTGKNLPTGCSIAVPSREIKEKLEPFTEGATVFVQESFSTQTADPEADEHLARDFFEGLLETVGVWFVVVAGIGACSALGVYASRQGPGGQSGRKQGDDIELQSLVANSDTSDADGFSEGVTVIDPPLFPGKNGTSSVAETSGGGQVTDGPSAYSEASGADETSNPSPVFDLELQGQGVQLDNEGSVSGEDEGSVGDSNDMAPLLGRQ